MMTKHNRVFLSIRRNLRDIRRDGLAAVIRKARRVPGLLMRSRIVFAFTLPARLGRIWLQFLRLDSERVRELAIERLESVRGEVVSGAADHSMQLAKEIKRLLIGGRFESIDQLVERADREVVESVHVRHQLAQLHYFRGNWSAAADIQVGLTEEMDRLAQGCWLSNVGVRFVSGAFVGHIGHLGLIDLIQRARYLGVLSPEPRIFVGRRESVANTAYVDCWRSHMQIHYLELGEFRAFEKMMGPLFEDVSIVRLNDSRPHFFRAYSEVNQRWSQEGRGPLISMNTESARRAREIFEAHGLGRGQWFVGLHVREGDPHPWTNAVDSDASTYLPAIRAVLRAGGAVIRIGSPYGRRLPSMDGLIDYAAMNWKEPELDLFVWSQCRFFVGTGSGPLNIPPTFGRPSIITNYPSFALDQGFSDHLMLPKRVVRGDGSHVPFLDVLSSPFGFGIARAYEGFDWRIEDNSPDELESAVLDMIDLAGSEDGLRQLGVAQGQILEELHRRGRTGWTPFPPSFIDRHPTLFG